MSSTRSYVLDVGSYHVRGGPAEGASPSQMFRAAVSSDGTVVSSSTSSSTTFRSPVLRGQVQSWDGLEAVISTCFSADDFDPSGASVLIAEQSLNPKAAREHTAQLLFESLDVGSAYICLAGQLALFASGLTSGVVLESGGGVTHAVPIYDGYPRREGILRAAWGGEDVSGMAASWLGGVTDADVDLATGRALKEQLGAVLPEAGADPAAAGISSLPFKLPDGSEVVVDGADRARYGEALFGGAIQDSLFDPFHTMVSSSVSLLDPEIRAGMYASVVLSGGNSLFPGAADRLRTELKAWNGATTPVSVTMPKDPLSAVWQGGSIVTQVGVFKKMCVTKVGYAEFGPNLLHRKCM